MSAVPKTKVLLVDDHPVIRQGLRLFLGAEEDFEVVGEAENGADALRALAAVRPDLVLVDLSMEGLGGLDLLKRLMADHPGVQAVVVSMMDEKEYGPRCLKAGAKGFVGKQEPPERIVATCRKVLAGGLAFSDRTVREALEARAPGRPGDAREGLARLSDREMDVFREIALGRKTRDIADRLALSVKTVETHVAHIKSKLGLGSSLQLAQYAARWAGGPAAAGAVSDDPARA